MHSTLTYAMVLESIHAKCNMLECDGT